jgi:transketolase
VGLAHPGHPEHGHTPGVETTTGPLGQGLGNAVGMAMAARRERGLFDPDAAPGASPFDHFIYAICSDGDIEEGISHEVSALAGHQKLGNLVVIYDDNEISIEDDTHIAKSEDVVARYAAYGWHTQHVDWRGPEGYHEDVEALHARSTRRGPRPAARLYRAAHDHRLAGAEQAEHRQDHGSALGADEVAATKRILGFDPEATFAVSDEVLSHARQVVDRGRAAHRNGRPSTTSGPRPTRLRLSSPRGCPPVPSLRDGPVRCRTSPRTAKGIATRAASGKVLDALARCCPSCGAARPTWPRATTPP